MADYIIGLRRLSHLSEVLPPLRSWVWALYRSNIWSHMGRVCRHSAESHGFYPGCSGFLPEEKLTGSVSITVFSSRLPAGNLLILTQNVSGAGNTAVRVICWFFYDDFFCATPLRKALCLRLLFSSLIVKATHHSLTNIVNALIHWFNFGLVTLLLHNRNSFPGRTHTKWRQQLFWSYMADADYLSVRVIQLFFSKNLHFCACAGYTLCG